MWTSPVGRITLVRHLSIRSIFGSSWIDWSVSLPSAAVVGWSWRARPRSSLGPSRRRVWAIHGNDAAMVEGVARTPGRISRANARVGGKAPLSAANARLALRSVGDSSRIVAWRLFDWAANAPVVTLKLVIRFCSALSLLSSAPATLPKLSISFERSWRSSPSRAWLTIDTLRNAGPLYLSDSLSAW